jgi:hypothetical protein
MTLESFVHIHRDDRAWRERIYIADSRETEHNFTRLETANEPFFENPEKKPSGGG